MEGTVRLSTRDGTALGEFSLRNLSDGGMLVEGVCPLAERAAVRVELLVPDHPPARCLGAVVRIELATFAVAFTEVAPIGAHMIETVTLEALAEARAEAMSAVLLLDDNEGDRLALCRDIGALLGSRTLVAKTALDVVRLLQDPHVRLHAAVVEASFGSAADAEILTFMASTFPDVRRVLAVRQSGSETVGESARLAHAVLRKPWTPTELRSAIGAR
jgi:hypothetical protein